MHSVFEQWKQYIIYSNNVAVENTNKCYAHRAYLENILCYNNDAKENLLRGDFFFPEEEKEQDYKDTSNTYLKAKDLITKALLFSGPSNTASA